MSFLLPAVGVGATAWATNHAAEQARLQRQQHRTNVQSHAYATPAPPKQIRDIIFTPDYANRKYRVVDSFPSFGGEMCYVLYDPGSGATIHSHGMPHAGQGEGN